MAAADGEQSSELSSQYLKSNFPSKYRELLVRNLREIEEILLKNVHEAFKSGKYKGKRMVDVGCGPTVHRMATFSKYYDEIILSDYAPENEKNVKKWLAADPDALDWTPLLEIVAACEGCSDLQLGVKNIEARMRRKIKSIIHCDVLKTPVFDPDIESVDLLFTSGCLESACETRESFASTVKSVGSYVKRGGYITTITFLGVSSAAFDGEELKALSLDESAVQDALKEAGFVVDHRVYAEKETDVMMYDGVLFIIAKKL